MEFLGVAELAVVVKAAASGLLGTFSSNIPQLTQMVRKTSLSKSST
jgi:hypothetical protein